MDLNQILEPGSYLLVCFNCISFKLALDQATQEVCSLSNGSLASSRIINHARSPHAQFCLFYKFPINTPYEKIQTFRLAIEEYLKARPREWLLLGKFAAVNVFVERAYLEYLIAVQ